MRVRVHEGGFTDAADACRSGNQIVAMVTESTSNKLSGFAGMAGDDASSVDFSASYDEAAREAIETLAELANAFTGLGRLVAASGANHGRAEAAAAHTPWYSGGALDDNDFVQVRPAEPASSLGSTPPPLGNVESWILHHIEGFVWPGADTQLLLEAAALWRHASAAIADVDGHCNVAISFLEGQQSPEIPLALDALADLRRLTGDAAECLTSLAISCEEYAEAVRTTHERTRAMLGEIGKMIVEGVVVSALVGGFTGGLGAGAAGGAAVARISAQAPRFHALISALRVTSQATSTRLRSTHQAMVAVRTRAERFARVSRNERGSIRLPGRMSREPGWLRAHETPPGHALKEHAGRTVDELVERCLSQKKRVSSSFVSDAEAERLVGDVVDSRRRDIVAWLRSGADDALVLDADTVTATGISVTKRGVVTERTGLRVVLIPNKSMPEQWQILTAYPK